MASRAHLVLQPDAVVRGKALEKARHGLMQRRVARRRVALARPLPQANSRQAQFIFLTESLCRMVRAVSLRGLRPLRWVRRDAEHFRYAHPSG
jgi:hypothetical protein